MLIDPKVIIKKLSPLNLRKSEIKTYKHPKTFHYSEAAVLLLIVNHPNQQNIVLTVRSRGLKNHAGQVSFPGGKVENFDKSLLSAALRETYEEIGFPLKDIKILGSLPSYDILTGFRVYPYVGWANSIDNYFLKKGEVDEIFEIPITFLFKRELFKLKKKQFKQNLYYYYSFYYKKRHIWGATAVILNSFYVAIK